MAHNFLSINFDFLARRKKQADRLSSALNMKELIVQQK
jgi:hypothetical protein